MRFHGSWIQWYTMVHECTLVHECVLQYWADDFWWRYPALMDIILLYTLIWIIPCYTTIAGTVQNFLYTHDARNWVENIILHAGHAGFTYDTHNIHANIRETVNSCVEYSLVLRIFTRKSRKSMDIMREPKRERHYIHIVQSTGHLMKEIITPPH